MRITRLVWDDDTVEHVGRHGVSPAEAEEVCRGQLWVLRGRQGFYYVMGQTSAGRYLFVVLVKRGALFKLATAREMDSAERRRYLNR